MKIICSKCGLTMQFEPEIYDCPDFDDGSDIPSTLESFRCETAYPFECENCGQKYLVRSKLTLEVIDEN